MTPERPLFTLIGDVVESRQAENRGLLQKRLSTALDEMNAVLEPRVPLEPTVGDEFQACFENVAHAIRASLMVRLELLRTADIDSRYGLGAGPVEIFSERRPLSQDGPGWWAAREAIGSSSKLEYSPQASFARTWFSAARTDLPSWRGQEAALNAFLLCRDALVDRMKQTSRNRLYGLMRGWSQSRIAAEEGATQGAISQSLARSGAFAIVIAQEQLEEEFR